MPSRIHNNVNNHDLLNNLTDEEKLNIEILKIQKNPIFARGVINYLKIKILSILDNDKDFTKIIGTKGKVNKVNKLMTKIGELLDEDTDIDIQELKNQIKKLVLELKLGSPKKFENFIDEKLLILKLPLYKNNTSDKVRNILDNKQIQNNDLDLEKIFDVFKELVELFGIAMDQAKKVAKDIDEMDLELENKSKANEKDQNKLKKEIKNLGDDIIIKDKKIINLINKINDLEIILESYKNQINNLEIHKNDITDEDILKEIYDLGEENSLLKKINAELESSINNTNSSEDKLLEENIILEKINKKLDIENNNLKTQNFSLLSENESLKKALVSFGTNQEFIEVIESDIENSSFDELLKYCSIKNLPYNVVLEITSNIDEYLGNFKANLIRRAVSSTAGFEGTGAGSYANEFVGPIIAKIKDYGNNTNPYNYLGYLSCFNLSKVFESIGTNGKTSKDKKIESVWNLIKGNNENMSLSSNLLFLGEKLAEVDFGKVDFVTLSNKMLELGDLEDSQTKKSIVEILKNHLKN